MHLLSINALYPLRIIGLNQDRKADGSGMAGLTFMFLHNSEMSVSNPGQFEDTASPLRQYVSETNGAIKQGLPKTVTDALAKVVKKHRAKTSNISELGNTGNIKTTEVDMFVLSVMEVNDNCPASLSLGVGANKDEDYMHFSRSLSSITQTEKRNRLQAFYPRDSWARDSVGDWYHWALNWAKGIYAGGTDTSSLSVCPAFCL